MSPLLREVNRRRGFIAAPRRIAVPSPEPAEPAIWGGPTALVRRAGGAWRRRGGAPVSKNNDRSGDLPAASWLANARFQEGLRRHDAGNEEEARLSFAEAYTVLKSPNILFNLARSEQLTGHPLDALAHYKEYARSNDAHVTAKDRDTAKQHIAELSAKVGHVAVDAPAGAKIALDGAQVAGEAPLKEPLDVAVGPHTVTARLGDVTKSAQVTAGAGDTVSAKLEFEAVAPATTPAITTTTPATTTTTQAPVVPDHTQDAQPTTFWTARNTTVVVLAGGALIAAGVGVGFALGASSQSSTVQTDHDQITSAGHDPNSFCTTNPSAPPCPELTTAADAHLRDQGLAAGFFIGAGALAVGAIAALVLWPDGHQEKATTARITPLIAPGALGARFGMSF